MKEPYGKGLATHSDPESCADYGNIMGEALTRAHAGQPWSSEIIVSACRPRPDMGKAIS
jgi:RNA-directed DNA polymerase